jgi:uncharacterized protein
MKHKALGQSVRQAHLLAFEPGEEVAEGLKRFARERDIRAATFTGIGAFERATLAFFDLDRREYDPIPIDEQVEVLSIAGNVGRHDGEPLVHAHVVVGKRDGSAVGGHLLEGHVRPTLEVILIELHGTIERRLDEATGLPLIAPDL